MTQRLFAASHCTFGSRLSIASVTTFAPPLYIWKVRAPSVE
jgi:hypothetical protein